MKHQLKEDIRDQYILDLEVLKRFISSGKLLDVGCNGGFFLAELGDEFDRFGTELDPSAVDFAKLNFPEFGKNISEGSIEEASFEENSFDVISMRGVIEHVSNPNEALLHVSNLLKDKGFFIYALHQMERVYQLNFIEKIGIYFILCSICGIFLQII